MCRNEAIPDWPRAPMAVPQVAVSQDNKGKGRMNESTIKQELEDEGHDDQVGCLSGAVNRICMKSFLQGQSTGHIRRCTV